MPPITNPRRDAAIKIAKLGIKIVLLHGLNADGSCTCGSSECVPDGKNNNSRGKHPRLKKWGEEATGDEATIRSWFHIYSNSNIGILLGPDSGIIDIESDDEEGEKKVCEIFGGSVPNTPNYRSGRGVHRLFKWRDDLPHKGSIALGCADIKLGAGGKVSQSVAPPSSHHSGKTYEWIVSPEECAFAEIPDDSVQRIIELAEKLTTDSTTRNSTAFTIPAENSEGEKWTGNGARCIAYLAKCRDAVSGQGGHNATFRAACECFKFGMSDPDALHIMRWFNEAKTGGEKWNDDELRHKLEDAKQSVEVAGEFGCRIKPEIKVGMDEMRVTDEVIAALARRENLYQQSGMLLEIRETPNPPACIMRPEGGIRAMQIPRPRLRELIADSASFLQVRNDKNSGEIVNTSIAVPANAVLQVESRGHWPGIPLLEGIVTSPQFLLDGSILTTYGYDKKSGLFYADKNPFPEINESPTREDAAQAFKILSEVVADFPCDETSRAAWVAIVLTGAARHAIDGPTPLFAIDANVRGSGKSLLADAVGIIHTGRQLPRTSAGDDDAEFRKRITATLIAGEPIVLLDNISGTLGCSSLDALLTSTTWTDRILGKSTMTPAIPAKSVWLATGNNLQFQADTARRTLRIRLESMEEKPEERTGFKHPRLVTWIMQERHRLAAAAVTILRAWHVAGRPDMKLPPWGSFDSWSRIVRNALVWAGSPDPGETRQGVQRECDREATLLTSLLNAWELADPHGCGMTVADAINRAEYGKAPALAAVFLELSGPGGRPNARSIGMKLHHLKGRVCGGRKFEFRNTPAGNVWLVRKNNTGEVVHLLQGTTGTKGTKSSSLKNPKSSLETS